MLIFAWNGRLRARKVIQWQFGVLASEYGVWFAPLPLALIVWAACSGWSGLPGALCAGAALALLLCPEVLSWRLRRTLDEKVRAAFAEIPCAGHGSLSNTRAASRSGFPSEAPRLLSYLATGGVARRIVFYPATRLDGSLAPCVVMVHSGGWESGSPEEFADCHRALAKNGYAVACVEYGLAPVFSWPTPRDDVRAGISRIKAGAAELGVDPDRLVLFGRSAGGQVALCVAYDEPDPSVRGVAAFYAPTDMVFSWRGAYDGDILDSPRLLKNYLGGRPQETPDIHAEASPTTHAAKRPVPTLLLHGGRDEIVWCLQMRRLARVLRRVGAPHLAVLVPWGRHAFDYRLNGPGGRVAFHALKGFLDAVTRP